MSEIKEDPARPEGEGGEKMLKRMNKSHEPLRNFGFSKIPWRPDMRILKTSGIFAVLNEGSDPDLCDWPPVDGFMWIYRPEELEACMREAGFREVQVYHGQDQMICVTGKK